MDDTDRKLIYLVCQNPRITYEEIARKLGISRQAVNSRMRLLDKLGVFRGFKAVISSFYLDEVVVAIWGKSEAVPLKDALDRLGESELTGNARVAGGNELYVTGILRNMSELSDYVEFVRKAAEMPEPTVGVVSLLDGINPESLDGGKHAQSRKRLSPLDLKIISSMHGDPRKPAAEIARDLGVSVKIVRRHLETMRSEEIIEFDIPLDTPPGEDMYTLLYVNLKGGAHKTKVAKRLSLIDPVHMLYFRSFSNLPSFLLGVIRSDKMTEIRGLLAKIEEDEDVISVTPNMMYFERTYELWDEKLIRGVAWKKSTPSPSI